MKQRRTLYNRLSAKHLQKLVEQRKEFPNMVAEAERSMNKNIWVAEAERSMNKNIWVIALTVGEMCTICDVLEIDWNNIFLIFEHE